ncbi:MAG TPA: hypothetical protein VGA53_01075 [Candidatus Paceibacterota bacterium]
MVVQWALLIGLTAGASLATVVLTAVFVCWRQTKANKKPGKSMVACQCNLRLGELEPWIAGADSIVFTDVDETQRWGKDDISSANAEAIKNFREHGLLIPITGAPLWHIPPELQGGIMYGESGGVLQLPNKQIVELVPEEGTEAIRKLRSLLGICAMEGLDFIDGDSVLLEGPRYVSLTLVSGRHPHYPGKVGTISIEKLEERIGRLIEDHRLPLVIRKGVADTYSWLDITVLFEKHNAVACFLERTGLCGVYYLGDGANDVESIKHPCVVPVGFKNSIPEIQTTCKDHGILIRDKDGPDGGAAEALSAIMAAL